MLIKRLDIIFEHFHQVLESLEVNCVRISSFDNLFTILIINYPLFNSPNKSQNAYINKIY